MIKNTSELKAKDNYSISEFQQKIISFLGNKLISLRLYGSKLDESDSEESDIDIFVVVEEVTPGIKSRIIDIAFDINLKYGVYISPRVVSLKLFHDPSFRSTPFIQKIQSGGLEFYERRD